MSKHRPPLPQSCLNSHFLIHMLLCCSIGNSLHTKCVQKYWFFDDMCICDQSRDWWMDTGQIRWQIMHSDDLTLFGWLETQFLNNLS